MNMEFNFVFSQLFQVKYLVLMALIASAFYVHFRGQVRHRLVRQLTDHSTFMAPINTFLYLFSAVPSQPYYPVDIYPELRILKENWKTIREEGQRLIDHGYICAAEKYSDIGFNSFFRRGWKRFYLKWYQDYHPS